MKITRNVKIEERFIMKISLLMLQFLNAIEIASLNVFTLFTYFTRVEFCKQSLLLDSKYYKLFNVKKCSLFISLKNVDTT